MINWIYDANTDSCSATRITSDTDVRCALAI